MKKRAICAGVFVIIALAFCGCQKKEEVQLSVISTDFESKVVTMQIDNQTQNTVCFGTQWDLEVLSDGVWVQIEEGNDFHLPVLLSLNPGEGKEYTFSYSHFDALQPGQYRVSKEIELGGNGGSAGEKQTISTTFFMPEM